MNTERRESVRIIMNLLEHLSREIDVLADAERDAFESRPVGLQQSSDGEASKQAFEVLKDLANVSLDATRLSEII